MAHKVCSWWNAYTFDNIVRRLLHNPKKMLGAYVRAGMTVMDVGCGMGFFSIGLARIVGETGRVISVDLQQEMLDVLQERAEKAGVADRIRTHPCEAGSIGIEDTVDFALAFWMVHEVPDAGNLLREIRSSLSADGKLLIAEPRFHVSANAFREMLSIARDVGLQLRARPRVRASMAALLEKG